MGPKKNEFPLEIEIRLAWEVEKRPILWDAKCDLYKRADLKPAVWENVAKCLGPTYSGQSVSNRFKNMKDTFMSNHRKVREFKNKCSGSGADDVFKPKWPLYSHLLFLAKACVQGSSHNNIPPSSIGSSDGTDSSLHSVSSLTEFLPGSSETARQKQIQQTPLEKDMQSTVNMYYDENFQQFMMIPVEEDNAQPGHTTISETSAGPCSPPLISPPPRPGSAPTSKSKKYPHTGTRPATIPEKRG